jgi:hypothetical protein
MKRLFNPMEMIRVLVRNDIRQWEIILYSVLFALPLFVHLDLRAVHAYLNDPLTLTNSPGGYIFSVTLALSIIPYFVVPVFLAWKKISFEVYIKYFISLNAPIAILTIIATIILEFIYAVINETPRAPISFMHFFLAALIILSQSCAMSYYMKQTIRLRDKNNHVPLI